MAEELPVAVTARGITKTYKDLTALSNVDLTLTYGRITGLVGPNGAGKTTLIRVLLGDLRPDSGTVSLRNGGRPRDVSIGAQTDTLGLDPSMTVRQTCAYFATVYGLSRDDIDGIIGSTGIAGLFRKRVGKMSSGERRRFEIALALFGDPECLLFDEPLNGLDPDAIEWFNNLALWLKARGKAVLVSSHILYELGKIADEVTILQHGVVRYAGPITAVGDVEALYQQSKENDADLLG